MAGSRCSVLEGFDAEDGGALGDAGELFDFEEGFAELAEGAFMEDEDHFDEFGVGIVSIDGGMGSGDADLMVGEDAGDVGNDAGLVVDREADVVGGFGVVAIDEGSGVFGGEEAAVGVGISGGFDEVGDDGGGGRALSGASAVEEGVAELVAFDGDGIEDAVDGGEDVFFREEGGLGADFDAAVFAFEDEGEEFDDVAEFGGEFDIEGGDFFDAADVDVLVVDEESVGDGAEEDGLVGGVPAVDVEGFVGFGIAKVFGFGEGFGVAEAGFGHPLEDVI